MQPRDKIFSLARSSRMHLMEKEWFITAICANVINLAPWKA